MRFPDPCEKQDLKMIVNIHKREGKILVAVCDSSLLGKHFAEDNRQLDLSAGFYQGEEKISAEAGDLLRNADFVNIVGEEAVALGIKEGVVDASSVRRISGIPFVEGAVVH